jgi:hypothetical protein
MGAQRQAQVAYTTYGGVCVASNERKENNVVEEFKLGNTTVKICDDYCRNTTPADVDAILARIARRAQAQLSTQQ